MMRFQNRIVCSLLAFFMIFGLLCSYATASTYSSQYLNSYRATAQTDSNGVIVLSAHVLGRGDMTEIGVKKIFLYESEDGKNFYQVKVYDSEDYPSMMGSGYNFAEDLFRYNGTVGLYYYASFYVYAGKDGAGDMRNYQTATVKATA